MALSNMWYQGTIDVSSSETEGTTFSHGVAESVAGGFVADDVQQHRIVVRSLPPRHLSSVYPNILATQQSTEPTAA